MSEHGERKFIMNQPNDKVKELFDLSLNRKLRDKVNEHPELIMKLDGEKGESAWDPICAAMDRISDTAEYLNENQPVLKEKDKKSIFIFYNFLNHSASMIDCINKLADIFGTDRENIDSLYNIFNELGSDNQGSDKKYFEYLRSLCSAHPVSTNRHKRYQDGASEWCPWVAWFSPVFKSLSEFRNKKDPDLVAAVYTPKEELGKRKPIFLDQIFGYARRRYEFINDILPKIDEYYAKKNEEYRQRKIKQPEDFDTYPAYLKNLQKEIEERKGLAEGYSSLNFIARAPEVRFGNPATQKLVASYQAALKPAVADLHETVQNICPTTKTTTLLSLTASMR